MTDKSERNEKNFEQLSKQKRPNIVSEFWFFVKHNKKWWLIPILLILLLLGIIVVLGSGAAAPFIYTLF